MTEFLELAIGIAVGIAVGIAIIYAIMKSRIPKEAQMIGSSLYEQQREQLESSLKEQSKIEFEKWKAEYEPEVQRRIELAVRTSLESQRSVLKGKIGEQISPLLPEFLERYSPSDARFLGSPVDYIIFKNMSKVSNGTDESIEIVFLDVKTGSSSLNKVQKLIRESIQRGKVTFDVLRPSIDKILTAKEDMNTVMSINNIPPPTNYKQMRNLPDSTEQ